jgi:3',5'-cyclic AMP phosphodiesterase CpdA
MPLAAPLATNALAAADADFTFVHFTDTHIQPELRAEAGVEKAFAAINAVKPAFCLAGGDLVFDVAETDAAKAKSLFDMYARAAKNLRVPVHSVPGNHDVIGLSRNGKVPPTDALYGKKMFEDRVGPRYSSFDHQGWHFIQLDSIGTKNGGYIGHIDEAQFDWLKGDLEKTGKTRPVVLTTHIALVTSMVQFLAPQGQPTEGWVIANTFDVLKLLAGYNVKAVLQGHTHVREIVDYNGCQYITSGAVSGNWWKGLRLGHPEGFGVLHAKGDKLTWEYKTYGWNAQA